jgi:methanogenic corrinoid protein MtbC1
MSVISRVNSAPHQRRNRRIDVGSKILLAGILDKAALDIEVIKGDLASLRIAPTDIVDYCIPQAARELGEAWADDRLSFAEVSIGSARLYTLCKAVCSGWDNVRPPSNSRSVLLTTIDREDHILGPAVLADQLRRRGHSVHLMSNGTATGIAEKLRTGRFDGLLISASTTHALQSLGAIINHLRRVGCEVPIILGGPALCLDRQKAANAGADLMTNDIETALDALTGIDVSLRVAE